MKNIYKIKLIIDIGVVNKIIIIILYAYQRSSFLHKSRCHKLLYIFDSRPKDFSRRWLYMSWYSVGTNISQIKSKSELNLEKSLPNLGN